MTRLPNSMLSERNDPEKRTLSISTGQMVKRGMGMSVKKTERRYFQRNTSPTCHAIFIEHMGYGKYQATCHIVIDV